MAQKKLSQRRPGDAAHLWSRTAVELLGGLELPMQKYILEGSRVDIIVHVRVCVWLTNPSKKLGELYITAMG